ncbi:MAG: FMN-binding protein [Thermodesulfobacteriota bacterium]
MKNILTIIFRLTVSCILAGLVMGATFVLTNKAKKHNEHVNEQKVMLRLLGYTDKHPAPASLALHEVYRYLIGEGDSLTMGYLVPTKSEGAGHGSFAFVTIDLAGNFVSQSPVTLAEEQAGEAEPRLKAIQAAVGGKNVRYADQTIVATVDGQRSAYLLPGRYPGFKTFIESMVALDPKFTILGLEIMGHEEDPGLGGEIVQKYFKNQFKAKPVDKVKVLDVVKTPLPEEYREALEADGTEAMDAEAIAKVEASYKDKDIYAITGATISSRAVTNGVKGMVKKFAYRIAILDKVLAEQQIATPF